MNVNPRTGNQYTATYSKEEFDADKSGDVILMENRNGSGVITPKFKEEQIKDAEAYIKSQMTSYIDKTAEKRPFQEPGVDYAPEYVVNRTDKTKKDNNSGNMLAKLYSGDSAEIQSAVDYFNGLSDVDAVNRTADGVVVTLSNGNTDVIKFKNPDGSLKTQADFIRSASKLLVGDDADLNAVLKGAVGTGKKAFNTTGSASAAVQKNEPAKVLSPQQKAKNYISAAITPDMINKTESEAVPLLLASLTKLGFDAEESGTGSYVTITAPGSKDKAGASKEFSLNDGSEAAAKVRQSIVDFVTANLGQEALLNADQAGVLEGIGLKWNK
jgi:hypothetical protein